MPDRKIRFAPVDLDPQCAFCHLQHKAEVKARNQAPTAVKKFQGQLTCTTEDSENGIHTTGYTMTYRTGTSFGIASGTGATGYCIRHEVYHS